MPPEEKLIGLFHSKFAKISIIISSFLYMVEPL